MITFAEVGVPAAGAPTAQILIATLFGLATTALLASVVARHPSGRGRLLARAGATCERAIGLPSWAALGFVVAMQGLAFGGAGVFWDVSLHIDRGRDVGPLANPSHYPILWALYSIFAAGVLSTALHQRAEVRSLRAVRLPNGIEAPVGGLLLILCGAFALSGFPLDDVWHRMFGQDVTLWGPTHLIMINGAILSAPTIIALVLEGKRATGHLPEERRPIVDRPSTARSSSLSSRWSSRGEAYVRVILPGVLLFAVAFWATEFDWGLPQFRLVWQPLLLSFGAAFALVVGVLWTGRWGAMRVVVSYLVGRIALTAMVGGLGQTMPAMPLFLVEALCVEALARSVDPAARPLRFGLLAGAVCGSVGFAAEYGWTQLTAPQPWTTDFLAEAVPTALAAGVAGGALGALLGMALIGRLPPRPVRRGVALAAAAVMVVLGANALALDQPSGVRADVSLTPAPGDDGRSAYVTAHISPASAAEGASWFNAVAWQGGGRRTAVMEPAGDGRWRSSAPLPLTGEWKTALRLHKDRGMIALALHMPRDSGVPTPGVSRPERFSALMVPDMEVVQTERRDYVPGWLWTPAALLMLALCGLFVAALSAGIVRATTDAPGDPGPSARRRPANLEAMAGSPG